MTDSVGELPLVCRESGMSTSADRAYYLERERQALSMAALADEAAHRELHQQLADLHAARAASFLEEQPIAALID